MLGLTDRLTDYALALRMAGTHHSPEQEAIFGRELLAVIFGLKKYCHYLLGRKILIRMDHAALRWVSEFKDPEGQVARWLQVLPS